MRYLSKEWIDAQHEETERMCPPDGYDCGGWTYDPPCGGCNRCIHMQTAHWIQKEIDRMRMFHAAGFEYADPACIQLDFYAMPGGYAPYHGEGGYHCWTAKEIDQPIFDWNRKANRENDQC